MREVLFRGKRTDNGEWVISGNLIQFIVDDEDTRYFIPIKGSICSGITDKNNNLVEIHDAAFYNVIPETVGQYTGLTDKNGKKIFEGDIIENINQRIFVVEYGRHDLDCCNCCYESHDALGFYMKNEFGSAESDEKVWEDIEVIGNIHDNPELLRSDEEWQTQE